MHASVMLRGGRKPRPSRAVSLRVRSTWRVLFVAKYVINGSKFEFTNYDQSRVDTRAAVLVANGISVVLTTRKERVAAHA